jgi:hypothetical protein
MMGQMTIGVLVHYPQMALDALILGMGLTAALRWMRCKIANSGIMISLINIQTSFVPLTVA